MSGLNTSLFGKSVSVTGSGISANSQMLKDIMDQGFQGQYYADVQTKKKAFGFSYSTSTSTQYSQLDSELKQQFSAIFRSVGNTVMTAADLLQVETSAVNKRLQEYVVSIGRIDLKNLSGEQIAEKLEAVFGAESDRIARAAIGGFESIQKVGEGYFETLSRVAAQFELVRVYTERLRDTFEKTGVAGGVLADTIVKAFGGIEEYQSSIQQYYEDFFTEEERNADKMRDITTAFSQLNLALPKTVEGYRALVNAQDLTTASGLAAYVALINLSGAFLDVTNAAQDAADNLYSDSKDATDAAFAGLKRSVDAASKAAEKTITDAYNAANAGLVAQRDLVKTAASVAKENVSTFKGIFDLLKTEIASLIGDTTAAMSSLQGRAFIEQSIATAQSTGYLPDQTQLADAITAVKTGFEQTAYTSAFEQQRDRLVLASRLGELKLVAGEQMTTAEKQLKLSEEQVAKFDDLIKQAKTQFDEDIETNRSYYQDMLDSAQKQIDIARGVDSSIKSVETAVSSLASSIRNELSQAIASGNAPKATAVVTPPAASLTSPSAAASAGYVTSSVNQYGSYSGIGDSGYRLETSATGATLYFPGGGTHSVSGSTAASVLADAYGLVSGGLNNTLVRTRATGGYTPPGLTLVGEQGPEIVNFKTPDSCDFFKDSLSVRNATFNLLLKLSNFSLPL